MKMVKKESPEKQGVSKGLWNGEEGRMEENAVAGVEKAGEEAASSIRQLFGGWAEFAVEFGTL